MPDDQRFVREAPAKALARSRRRPILHGFVLGLIAFGVFSSIVIPKTFPFQLQQSTAITGLSLPSMGAPPPEEPVLTSAVLPQTMGRADLERALLALAAQPTAGPALGALAEGAQPSPTPAPIAQYIRYNVQAGDTASAIASRFGITLQYLLWNNPELRDGNVLAVGDVLFIPAGNGILHYVSLGETLSGIASHYSVTVADIINWPGNEIASPDQVIDGQLVFVPGGVPPASVAPEPEPTAVFVAGPTPIPRPEAPAAATPAPPPAQQPSGSGMIWPFVAPLSRGFGGGHMGIDIDGFGREGAAIVAATSGTISFAGGDSCCGYGLYVDVRSADGIVTRYAHLSRISVSLGQQVSQGQTLGIIGRTGNATGTHLHFEVRVNGVPRNPLNYLP